MTKERRWSIHNETANAVGRRERLGLSLTVLRDRRVATRRVLKFFLMDARVEHCSLYPSGPFDLDEDAIGPGLRESIRETNFRRQPA